MKFIEQLKRYLKPIKRFFSRKYKKTYSQAGEDIIISSALGSMKISKVKYLDIGAHHPFYLSNTYLFYTNGGSGVCVEPDPYLFKLIQKKRPKDKCLNIGIGVDRTEEADFYLMSAKTLNTFSKSEAEKVDRETKFKIQSKIKIPLESVNTLIDKYFDQTPNFISLDVEGLDMEILRSFDFNKYRPEIFCVETLSFTDDNTGEKDQDIIDFMISNNYFVFADTHINTIFIAREKWENK